MDASQEVSKILDKNARERLSMLRTVRPELANELEKRLAEIYRSGQVKGIISEEKFILILRNITEKREPKITRIIRK